MDNISCISDNNNEEITLSIDDIKKIWKKDYTEIINSKDKLLGRLFDFNIYQYNKMILIGFNNSVAKSWYKLKSINDLHIFIEYFKEKELTDKNKSTEKQVIIYLTSRFNFIP